MYSCRKYFPILVIRNYLKGAIPKGQVKHAYVPDVYGKERRKRAPGKEGKLGVEGMSPDVLRQVFGYEYRFLFSEQFLQLPRRIQRVQRRQQGLRAHPLRQAQPLQQLPPPLCRVRRGRGL